MQSHGAEVLEPEKDGLPIQKATHIIANSIDFEEYKDASDMMVPVVMSDWIIASLHRNRQAQIRPYSPDPRMIFAGVTLTCADIPPSDKEAIAGAIIALGGTESQDLSRMTTHICALSMDNPKCQQAKEKGLKCKVVLPHWYVKPVRLLPGMSWAHRPVGSTTASGWGSELAKAPIYSLIPRSSA